MAVTLLLGIVGVNGKSLEGQSGLTGTVVSVLLDSCVLFWSWLTTCFFVPSLGFVHSELWVFLGTLKQACGSLVGHLTVSLLVFLQFATFL